MRVTWVLFLWMPLLAAGADSNRYIVELSGDPVAEHVAKESKRTGQRLSTKSEAAQTRLKQIQKEQQDARKALKDLGVEVLESTQTVSNSLIVRMPDDLVEKVEALPGVKRVSRARTVKPQLDHAVPLHRVPQAWKLIGVDKAGLGVKIGLIDSGIDIGHPGMQDSSLPMPAGFPKTNFDTDVAFTNTKVIVARSYANLFDPIEDDLSARDRQGHGTATAMVAAGVRNKCDSANWCGSLGAIEGVAPKAYLGSYKVFGSTGGGTTDVVLKAIDDAVADGMDIISLSLSSAIAAPRLTNDIEVDAIERITGLGVLVVSSAGNKGGLNTIGSPGTAPSMITVGASYNDRFFLPPSVQVDDDNPVFATTGGDTQPEAPITGPLFDVFQLDQDGLGCLPFPFNTFNGKIAFIKRGSCTFEEKLNNVGRAGAIAAVIYTDDRPLSYMNVGSATLPGLMITNSAGVAIKEKLVSKPSARASLNFRLTSIPADADEVAAFSSRGPNVDGSIKPDLVATGSDFFTATEKSVQDGELYDPSGYTIVDGTSFAVPLVAGAAAMIKGARPGLTAAQYRSLLINSASPITSRVQESGAGVLNVEAAMKSTLAIAPTSLNFKTGGADPNLSQTLTISNVGNSAESYSLTVVPRDAGAAPTLGTATVSVEPGKSATVPVKFTASGLTAGRYEGFVKIRGTNSNIEARAPYWYAVPSNVPGTLTPLWVIGISDDEQPRAGARVSNAIYFRVTDASGIALPNVEPTVTPVSGGGTVLDVASVNQRYPGVFSVSVRLGATRGDNVFRLAVGDVAPVEIAITGN
jgi:minor extracellular serine protease Vpr